MTTETIKPVVGTLKTSMGIDEARAMADSIYSSVLWAGTQQSLDAARASTMQMIMAGVYDSPDEEDPEDCPYNYELVGDIGVITIKGGLTNRDSWVNRYYGLMSYNEIRAAFVYGAKDVNAKRLAMIVTSGGGAVEGCDDTAQLIALIGQFKQVDTYAQGTMASAAFWIGMQGKKKVCSSTSLLGSIGVLMQHMEYSKLLKEMGISAEILRAGEFKALVNQIEPLTEAARKQAQTMLDATYNVFISAVASAYNTTAAIADATMGQGREFVGQAAVDAGLASGVTTLSEFLGGIQAELDKAAEAQSNQQNFGINMGHQTNLTAQQLAAMAAGATPTAAPAAGTTAAAPAAAPAAGTTAAPTAAAPAADTTAPTASANPASQGADPVLAYVKGELAAEREKNVSLNSQVAALTAQVSAMSAQIPQLVTIVGASLSNMRVALGHRASTVDPKTANVDSLLADHAAAAADFNKAFHAGGVAAATQTESAQAGSANEGLRKARLAATSAK